MKAPSAPPKRAFRHGRSVLLGIIVLGLLLACGQILHFVATGALTWDVEGGGKQALEHVVSTYSPSLGIIGAYYFSERLRTPKHPASNEAFAFSVVVTAIVSLTPPIVIAVVSPTSDALDFLRTMGTLTQAIFAGAISYYFARGQRTDGAGEGKGEPGRDGQRPPTAAQ
jgi:hypothetical protein